ncbi:hypothetical protein Tco_0483177 [Tanacetum coccineum]
MVRVPEDDASEFGLSGANTLTNGSCSVAANRFTSKECSVATLQKNAQLQHHEPRMMVNDCLMVHRDERR